MSQNKSSALDALVKGSHDLRAQAEPEAFRRVEFWARALVRASGRIPARPGSPCLACGWRRTPEAAAAALATRAGQDKLVTLLAATFAAPILHPSLDVRRISAPSRGTSTTLVSSSPEPYQTLRPRIRPSLGKPHSAFGHATPRSCKRWVCGWADPLPLLPGDRHPSHEGPWTPTSSSVKVRLPRRTTPGRIVPEEPGTQRQQDLLFRPALPRALKVGGSTAINSTSDIAGSVLLRRPPPTGGLPRAPREDHEPILISVRRRVPVELRSRRLCCSSHDSFCGTDFAPLEAASILLGITSSACTPNSDPTLTLDE